MADADSDEEDYMSDAFLAKCGDTRPGLVPDRIAKQYQKEVKGKQADQLHRQLNPPRQQVEKEKRDEGLKSALTSENKGFKLLAKMGYKPGTAIGKSGVGKLEPVAIEIKTGRGGLGEEADKKRKQDERVVMRTMMARKRQKHEEEWRETLRSKLSDRDVEADLQQSQKVCEQLDSEQGYDMPERLFFWPPAFLPPEEEEEEEDGEKTKEELPAAFDKDMLLTPIERLEILTEYLRATYKYCTWCGTRFDDDDDLRTSCPGNTGADHR